MMDHQLTVEAIRTAGAVQLVIIVANIPLPGMLRVQERLAGIPNTQSEPRSGARIQSTAQAVAKEWNMT